MSPPKTYPLFSRFGVELEYMIVSLDSLSVLPISDRLIEAANGTPEPEILRGEMAWNNELVLHLIEFKTAEPAHTLVGIDRQIAKEIADANAILANKGAILMPTGMHPWMVPKIETLLWPHEGREIYQTFHKLFNCKRHGWANLQSIHLNLPFKDDAEFERLHAAIRVLLPLIPALAASTPFVEGKKSGFIDYRMEVYRTNAVKVPRITGLVIPEVAVSKNDYHKSILDPIYKDIRPIDPKGVLQEEWVNARGCIARFERNTIEIRVIDTQESPTADLAILQAIVHVLKKLTEEGRADELNALSTDELHAIFCQVISKGEETLIDNSRYLKAFGQTTPMKAKDLWKKLLSDLKLEAPYQERLDHIFKHGTLSTRLLRHFDKGEKLESIYRQLTRNLADGQPFV